MTDSRLKPLADAIEEALYASKFEGCKTSPCERGDCTAAGSPGHGHCRARIEFIVRQIVPAAVLYAGHGRDPQERIDELLASNNELLERARKAAQTERDAIAAEARRYASHYSEGSDGRNTFILLAEWVEARR